MRCRLVRADVRPQLISVRKGERKVGGLKNVREEQTYPRRLNQPLRRWWVGMGDGQIRFSFHRTQRVLRIGCGRAGAPACGICTGALTTSRGSAGCVLFDAAGADGGSVGRWLWSESVRLRCGGGLDGESGGAAAPLVQFHRSTSSKKTRYLL